MVINFCGCMWAFAAREGGYEVRAGGRAGASGRAGSGGEGGAAGAASQPRRTQAAQPSHPRASLLLPRRAPG